MGWVGTRVRKLMQLFGGFSTRGELESSRNSFLFVLSKVCVCHTKIITLHLKSRHSNYRLCKFEVVSRNCSTSRITTWQHFLLSFFSGSLMHATL